MAILSLSCTLPVESAAGPDWSGIALVRVHTAFVVDESLSLEQPGIVPEVRNWLDEADLARARQDVAAARSRADIVLAVVHWGVPLPWRAPWHPILQAYQRTLDHALIDAGADAVLGNHAHEVHGIECYTGRPIAYCLGNFWIDNISSYPWMGRESLVLHLTLTRGGTPEVEIASLFLDDDGVPRPDPAHRAVAVLSEQSRELGVTVEERAGRFVVRGEPTRR